MLEKINRVLTIAIRFIISIFVVGSAYRVFHYMFYPELYMVYSAPWYTSIIIYAVISALIIMVLYVAKLIIKNMIKNRLNYSKKEV